jgi:hypothetical protein
VSVPVPDLDLDRSLDNLSHYPALALRQWPCLFDPDDIAWLAEIGLIVSQEFARPGDPLVIKRMAPNIIHGDYDGLLHLVTRNPTDFLCPWLLEPLDLLFGGN